MILRILILEDDLFALAHLLRQLTRLERKYQIDYGIEISVVILSEYTQVETWVNKGEIEFDLLLLDRDCKAKGSFHVVDLTEFNLDRIISISSIDEWNENAQEMGITRVIKKEWEDVKSWAIQVAKMLDTMLYDIVITEDL